MSIRRMMTVGVLATTAVLLPALPGVAAPSTGSCNPDPTRATTLTITASSSTITAGNFSSVFGKFTSDGCAVKGASIAVQRRLVVNGTPSGSWATVKTVPSSSQGIYAIAYFATNNVQVRARFTGTGSFPTTTSPDVGVNVRTAVVQSVRKLASCKLRISGGTTPAKPGKKLLVQNHTSTGYHTVARPITNSRGRYSVTKTFVCGRTYHLSTYIAKTANNLAGRSPSATVTATR